MPVLPAAAAEAAATAEAAEDEDDIELEEVQVTGTRIQNPNVTSSNPITSITSEEMRQLGIVNVADALLMLVPQNISTYQPGLTGDIQTTGGGEFGNIGIGFGNGTQGSNDVDRGSLFIGNTIANLRGMDPAFGTRTLTLIDGRRTVSSSSQADIVDMNIIPSNLLERMDVVTGGASATYGSGAMAGVVNLVLNSRLQGFNVDLTYGINEAGDGASPQISISGGTRLGSRGHALVGVEWQDQKAIRNCADARAWCAESRAMFTNSQSSLIEANYDSPVISIEGFEGLPARFQMADVRYNQFSPSGVLWEGYSDNRIDRPAPTTGYRFTSDGRDIEEFSYGFRGARNQSSAMNGDGPLSTTGTTLRPESERKNLFTNFEFDFTERTTGYLQASYAMTNANNTQRYTQTIGCARFDAPGVPAQTGGKVVAGETVYFGTGTIAADQMVVPAPPYNQPATPGMVRNEIWNNPNFRAFIGNAPAVIASGITARVAPYIGTAAPSAVGADTPTQPPPNFAFSDKVVPGSAQYVFTKSPNSQSRYWLLTQITMAEGFEDPGVPPVLPPLGSDSYAFLNQLSPEALNQVQAAFNRNPGASGTNAATAALWGQNPCAGFTALRKVWNPQIQQYATSDTDTWRAVAGVRGRFGGDWRWDAYFQHGRTDSVSRTFNGTTSLSLNFAMDAVIDNRPGSATYGQPVCRITRDGIPALDTNGLPMSDTAGLQALAADCQPLNILGDYTTAPVPWEGLDMTSAEMAQMQRDALAYAFKDSISDGATDRQTLSFNTNGTLWEGWGAGPLTGAFGIELSQDMVDNKGTRGSFYLRSDLASWNDSFGGKTRSTEGFTEFNMPLISGVEGIHRLSINGAARYTSYYNKGGAGTTGESATQGTFNWKFSTEFAPFDFVRFRLTRSADLRAATYRDLFLNQPTLPDQATGRNWWRERTEESNINQNERWGLVRVGNADLKPERSNTLTLGMVLSPGGSAQGMRLSVDYFDIGVKGGIYTPYGFASPSSIIENCWIGSGNSELEDHPNFGLNLAPNMDNQYCKEITFHTFEDGSIDQTDIVYVNSSRPDNGLPYQRRGVDLALNYAFPLSRAFERVPGSMSVTVRATRALEASGLQQSVSQRVTSTGELNCNASTFVDGILICDEEFRRVDMVGQIRSSQFIPGISATPKWTGSVTTSYMAGDFSASLNARYIGAAKMDNTWCDADQFEAGSCTNYIDELGRYLGGSVDNNWVDPYVNFTLSGTYNLNIASMRQFQLTGTVNNLFDKTPPFTGGGISGASAGFHDTFGRAYRLGVRMRF
jgi:outer membrane receptor protein involved in Fe transport